MCGGREEETFYRKFPPPFPHSSRLSDSPHPVAEPRETAYDRATATGRAAPGKDRTVDERQSAESWLRKALRNAPKPLPPGVFPKLLDEAEQAGFSRFTLNDVVDEWLNFGYCRVTDHVSSDIRLTREGNEYFGHRTIEDN